MKRCFHLCCGSLELTFCQHPHPFEPGFKDSSKSFMHTSFYQLFYIPSVYCHSHPTVAIRHMHLSSPLFLFFVHHRTLSSSTKRALTHYPSTFHPRLELSSPFFTPFPASCPNILGRSQQLRFSFYFCVVVDLGIFDHPPLIYPVPIGF